MRSILSPIIGKDNPPTIEHSARTAAAAVVSLFVARWFGLSESYWAAITTLVVMQPTPGAALPISAKRIAGTALGAALGALRRRECHMSSDTVRSQQPREFDPVGLTVVALACAAARLK
jgi:hypothetical protein